MTQKIQSLPELMKVKTKRCCRCKGYKKIISFGVDNSRKDGLNPLCKVCSSEDCRTRYKTNSITRTKKLKRKWLNGDRERIRAYNKRKYIKFGDKERARGILRYAVKTGKIERLPCEKCGNPKSHGHHDNYKFPLKVRWLCDIHHKEIHGKLVFPASDLLQELTREAEK